MTKHEVLAWLKRRGTQRNIRGMARYGIVARRAFGVSVGTLQSLKKRLGRDHALALELWSTGWFEARLLAALVDDPERVTRRQMDAWVAGFENWADCDTVCFQLFDRSPLAWQAVRRWSHAPREFVKRAAFALLASLALHDKTAPDRRFVTLLPLIAKGARDERNFVKKGVSWALRGIGRRNVALHRVALALAKRLAASEHSAARWIGRDAARDLLNPKVRARLARRAR